jgi:hypothetical protein
MGKNYRPDEHKPECRSQTTYESRRARIHGDMPHRCIRPSLRDDDSGSSSRVAVSIRPDGSAVVSAATGIMAVLYRRERRINVGLGVH